MFVTSVLNPTEPVVAKGLYFWRDISAAAASRWKNRDGGSENICIFLLNGVGENRLREIAAEGFVRCASRGFNDIG